MIKKLLFLFFSRNGRIGRFDFFTGILILLIILMITDFYFILQIIDIIKTSETSNINSLFIYIILSTILTILACYPAECLKAKRFQDLGKSTSFFSFNNNILELNSKGNDLDNDFGKREVIFDGGKNKKIFIYIVLILILISIIILFPMYIIQKYT